MQNPSNSLSVPASDMAAEAQVHMHEDVHKQTLPALCGLLTQRNTLSPIFRLPPEMLAGIFIHGARDYHEEVDHPPLDMPSWVNVSYVCRDWRDVALNCSALWTYHFVVSKRWTDELLARSKHASLKICIFYQDTRPRCWWLSLIEKVMSHAERIQGLRLNVPAKILSTILPLRAPCLQDLELETWSRVPAQLWSSEIFNGGAPALRALKLSYCPMLWHPLQHSGLTTLSLHHVPLPIQQNIVEFRATLIYMQGLTDLQLWDALASARHLPAHGEFQKINLPRLAHLSVVAPVSTVIALLSCVTIPLKAEVKLTFESEPDPIISDYALVPSVLAQRHSISEDSASSSPIIRSLVINPTRDGHIIKFSTLERDCDPHFPNEYDVWGRGIPLKIKVDMGPSATESNRDRLTNDICHSMPLANVQSLHVRNPPSSAAFWMQVLGNLQGLRYIKLTYAFLPDLAAVLGETSSGHGDQTEHIFAPALEEVELHCLTFPWSKQPGSTLSERLLCDVLSTRKVRLTMILCDSRNSDGWCGWWD